MEVGNCVDGLGLSLSAPVREIPSISKTWFARFIFQFFDLVYFNIILVV